jgi:hypothetical protein
MRSKKNFQKEMVYKTTFPNSKIYIGLISSDSKRSFLTYFGSSNHYIEQDFTTDQMQKITLTREILWESETATHAEARTKENELIRQYRSNDPAVGYNRTPRLPGAVYPAGQGYSRY